MTMSTNIAAVQSAPPPSAARNGASTDKTPRTSPSKDDELFSGNVNGSGYDDEVATTASTVPTCATAPSSPPGGAFRIATPKTPSSPLTPAATTMTTNFRTGWVRPPTVPRGAAAFVPPPSLLVAASSSRGYGRERARGRWGGEDDHGFFLSSPSHGGSSIWKGGEDKREDTAAGAEAEAAFFAEEEAWNGGRVQDEGSGLNNELLLASAEEGKVVVVVAPHDEEDGEDAIAAALDGEGARDSAPPEAAPPAGHDDPAAFSDATAKQPSLPNKEEETNDVQTKRKRRRAMVLLPLLLIAAAAAVALGVTLNKTPPPEPASNTAPSMALALLALNRTDSGKSGKATSSKSAKASAKAGKLLKQIGGKASLLPPAAPGSVPVPRPPAPTKPEAEPGLEPLFFAVSSSPSVYEVLVVMGIESPDAGLLNGGGWPDTPYDIILKAEGIPPSISEVRFEYAPGLGAGGSVYAAVNASTGEATATIVVSYPSAGAFNISSTVYDGTTELSSDWLQVHVAGTTLEIDPPGLSDALPSVPYTFNFVADDIPASVENVKFTWSFGVGQAGAGSSDAIPVSSLGQAATSATQTYAAAGAYGLVADVRDVSTDEVLAQSLATVFVGSTRLRTSSLGSCGSWRASKEGGEGVTVDDWSIAGVPENAVFDIRYNAYSVPDKFLVDYPVSNRVVDSGW